MSRARSLRLAVLAVIATLVAIAIKTLRGPDAPVFAAPPQTKGLLSPTTPAVSTSVGPDEQAPLGTEAERSVAAGSSTSVDPSAEDRTEVRAENRAEGEAEDTVDDEAETTVEDTVGKTAEITDQTATGTGRAAGTAAGSEPSQPGRRWAFPIDDECPPTHPIKAKLRSGIYHLPGMLAYDRAKPDRCYASETDAQADGLRRAKR